MRNMKKHALILGAVLTLSYCQGRQANVFDPTRGANYMTAGQYLNTPIYQNTMLPGRSQQYTYQFSQADYQRCAQEGAAAEQSQTQLSDFCSQLIMDLYNRNGFNQYYGNNYPTSFGVNFNQPGMAGATSNPFSFNVRNFVNANPSYVSGYPNQWGSYRTPVNMGSFCNNTGAYTNMQYSSPCGSMNYWYATYNLQGNQAYNQMLNGNVSMIPQVYGPQGIYATRAPGLYTGVAGYYRATISRNSAEESKIVKANVQAKWADLKRLPGTALGKVELTGMNVLESIANGLVARVENAGSRIVANNAMTTGMLQANTDFNYGIADTYSLIMLPTATANVALMADPDEGSDCAPETFHYEINPDTSSGNGYVVECPNK